MFFSFELYAFTVIKSVNLSALHGYGIELVPAVGLGLKRHLVYCFWGMDLYICFLILSLIEINSTDWSHTSICILFSHQDTDTLCGNRKL